MAIPTNSVFSLMAQIATCLCAEIKDSVNGVPDVCFCGVVPGDAAAFEYAGDCEPLCGMAWVRLITMYPATTVGSASEDLTRCQSGVGVDFEVGIMRCADVGDDFGNPPSSETLLLETELQIADALLMRKAIVCCPDLGSIDMRLGAYIPSGPNGGMVGGLWTVSAVL